MVPLRFTFASLAGVVLLTSATTPVLAANPSDEPIPERALTRPEQTESDRKAAAAERYVASVDDSASSDGDLAPLACVVPNSEPMVAEPTAPLTGLEVIAAPAAGSEAETFEESGQAIAPLTTCTTPQGFIWVEARDQIRGHYCGPAVGQVIANYTWGMSSGANKYTQGQLATWMGTDASLQTNAWGMEAGLERATDGAPRRPANWNWIVTVLRDTDGDGLYGDQLHTYVRANVSGSRMGLAVPVKPHDRNSPSGSHLASWPVPVNSVGHWVSIYGWVYGYDGTDRARMYYTDSSKDEGGGTGKYWTPTRRFTFMILEHTGRLVW